MEYSKIMHAPFYKRFFQDKNGKIVIMQSPNMPISTWAVATIAAKLFARGTPHAFFDIVAFGALFTWAWLEIFQGSSPFRRVLGALIMAASLYSRI